MLNFPSTPNVGDTLQLDGITWVFDGVKWSHPAGSGIGSDVASQLGLQWSQPFMVSSLAVPNGVYRQNGNNIGSRIVWNADGQGGVDLNLQGNNTMNNVFAWDGSTNVSTYGTDSLIVQRLIGASNVAFTRSQAANPLPQGWYQGQGLSLFYADGSSGLDAGWGTLLKATFDYTPPAVVIGVGGSVGDDVVSLIAEYVGLAQDSNGKLVHWTTHDTPMGGWQSVAYGNGLFVAVASSGTTPTNDRVMTSPDGVTWTARTASEAMPWNDVCYGNGLFVAVAAYGTTGSKVMTSPDGINWTSRPTAFDAQTWVSVCYGNGLFVAVLSTGTGNRVMTSPDGITWTNRATPVDSAWASVAYGNNRFVAVASSATLPNSRSMVSTDGINWTSSGGNLTDNSAWNAVCYGNGLFVAVGMMRDNSGGTSFNAATSTDGLTWSVRVFDGAGVRAIVYANGWYVAGGLSSQSYNTPYDWALSRDGVSWRTCISRSTQSWTAICFGQGKFVSVSNSGSTTKAARTLVMPPAPPMTSPLQAPVPVDAAEIAAPELPVTESEPPEPPQPTEQEPEQASKKAPPKRRKR